jgi:hypothetical protein
MNADVRPEPAPASAGHASLRLDPAKFRDPAFTARGEARASVALRGLETLWFNTGTLCNLTCANCYIESSPTNDRLAWLTTAEVAGYLDEIARDGHPTRLIGFTGGEPFMNPDLPAMLELVLARGFEALVLTNAMRPMAKVAARLAPLARFGRRLQIRVSLDHPDPAVHEAERGRGSWAPAVAGLQWLAAHGFDITVAGRLGFGAGGEAALRAGFARLFAGLGVAVDAADPARLVLFPEMDPAADVPEITTACWGILGKAPDSVMCATSRMVVKHRGRAPSVAACTLLPYDAQFDLGATLAEAGRAVALNHPHCARFCVLGGAACST